MSQDYIGYKYLRKLVDKYTRTLCTIFIPFYKSKLFNFSNFKEKCKNFKNNRTSNT